MKTNPACKYGHGDLVEIKPEPHSQYWSFTGVSMQRFAMGLPMGQSLAELTPSGHVYIVKLCKCPECGYMEIFDFEVGDA